MYKLVCCQKQVCDDISNTAHDSDVNIRCILPVISVINTIPVIGARTMPANNPAMLITINWEVNRLAGESMDGKVSENCPDVGA